MSKSIVLSTGLLLATSLFAQGPVQGSGRAHVQIVSQSTWQKLHGFTALSQVEVEGVVEQVRGSVLHLRASFGVLRVQLGEIQQGSSLRVGESLVVVASKIMKGGTQQLLATEVIQQG